MYSVNVQLSRDNSNFSVVNPKNILVLHFPILPYLIITRFSIYCLFGIINNKIMDIRRIYEWNKETCAAMGKVTVLTPWMELIRPIIIRLLVINSFFLSFHRSMRNSRGPSILLLSIFGIDSHPYIINFYFFYSMALYTAVLGFDAEPIT